MRTLAALPSGRAMFLLDGAGIMLVWPPVLALVLWGGLATPGLLWLAPALLYPALHLLAVYALGLYRRDVVIEFRRSAGRMPLVASLGAAGAAACLALIGLPYAGLGANGSFGPVPLPVIAAGCFIGAGVGARATFDMLRRRGLFCRRLLIIGAGRRAWDLVWILQHEGVNLAYQIAFVHDPALGTIDPRLADGEQGEVLLLPPDGFLALADRFGADQIVVAPDERRGLRLEGLLDCKVAGYPVHQYLTFLEKEARRIDLKRMELSWLLYSDGFYFGLVDRVFKRTLDLLVSGLALLLFAPILMAAMLAVKLEDGGPVFYGQPRITRGGRVFMIRKLRTMGVNAEAGGAVWAAQQDQRITASGAFLRRTRIDELPQLLNILSGEMSFVGPRPERPAFVAKLTQAIPLYAERHTVKAGLTGWAQVNYPYGASINDARSKLSYDLYYVKNFSIWFDVLIILQTLRVVLWPGNSVR